jgi:hypothetical protein
VVTIVSSAGGAAFYWAAGLRVTTTSGPTRCRTHSRHETPGFWPAFFVTIALMMSAALVAFMGGLVPQPNLPWSTAIITLGFWISGAVFALRGVAGFVPGVFKYAEGTPFMRLNQWFYSPSCLAIAAGYVAAYNAVA